MKLQGDFLANLKFRNRFLAGMAIPTLFLWPLGVLHGRKPYVIFAISLLLPLQLPQALPLLVSDMTFEYSLSYLKQASADSTESYAVVMLFFRSISGVILGFANMSVLGTLTDMWGVDTGKCCRGGVYSPSEHVMGQARRKLNRGGGLGAWLGLWAAVMIGGSGMGYCFGSLVSQSLHPSWGFWIVAIIGAKTAVMVIITSETRPPQLIPRAGENQPYFGEGGIIPHDVYVTDLPPQKKGEIHLFLNGNPPQWWWQEVWAGWLLMYEMCSQGGFLILLVFLVWAFGVVVMLDQVCSIYAPM